MRNFLYFQVLFPRGAARVKHNSLSNRLQISRRKSSLKDTTSSSGSHLNGYAIVQWYSKQLDRNPLTTKCFTSGVIAGMGDYMSQMFIKKENQWDFVRTGQFVFLGTALVGPSIHLWYNFLANAFPGTTSIRIIQRVMMDQIVFTPVFMSVWLSSLWTLDQSHKASDFSNELVRQLPSLMTANWSLWVPAQLVNFRFIPVKFQVLFSNVVALAWNCYLSYSQSPTQQRRETKIKYHTDHTRGEIENTVASK